jgi:hypothetical protein
LLPWFVLGVCLLAAVVLGARWFVSADPKLLARIVKWGGLGLAVAVVVYLGITGRLAVALPALLALVFLARRMRGGFSLPRGRPAPSSGQTSEVETAYLTMTLDHDSGAMHGRVLRGRFAGAELEELTFEQLLELLAECRRQDEQAAQVLVTFLERIHAEAWADHLESGGETGGRAGEAGTPRMSSAEAYEVLGLEPGATEVEIKEAHRRLMQKIHPDHGGSTFLASKINQAKDVLLAS